MQGGFKNNLNILLTVLFSNYVYFFCMKIVLSISEGHIVKNLLENGLIESINKRLPEAEVILITPAYRIQEFTETWSERGVYKFEKLLPYRSLRKHRILSSLRKKLSKRGWKQISRFLLKREYSIHTAQKEHYLKILEPIKEEVLVLCTHIHLPNEAPLLNAARSLNIPSIGIVNSWDNVYKGIESHPDLSLVWNDINKKEMMDFEGYPSEAVECIGVPAFDPYFVKENHWSREEFCKKIGFDPKRPILLYATIGQFVPFFEETFLLKTIIEITKMYPLERRPQVICRLHPWSKREIFNSFKNEENLYFSGFKNYLPTLGWCPTYEEVVYAGNLLNHSDICLTPGSTMTLEAAIFDTPIIVPVFNDYQPEIWEDYYSRFCLVWHFGRLVREDLLPLVRNKQELKDWIDKYLSDPSLYKMGRKRIVDDYVQFSDGGAINRLVDVIEKTVKQNHLLKD